MPAYKRILLKLSGEALMGDDAYGINRATIVRMVREIQEVTQLGVEVARHQRAAAELEEGFGAIAEFAESVADPRGQDECFHVQCAREFLKTCRKPK